MSWSFNLHFISEEEQPTMAQCEAVRDAILKLLDEPTFEVVDGFQLETPSPLDLDMSKVRRMN